MKRNKHIRHTHDPVGSRLGQWRTWLEAKGQTDPEGRTHDLGRSQGNLAGIDGIHSSGLKAESAEIMNRFWTTSALRRFGGKGARSAIEKRWGCLFPENMVFLRRFQKISIFCLVGWLVLVVFGFLKARWVQSLAIVREGVTQRPLTERNQADLRAKGKRRGEGKRRRRQSEWTQW